MRIRVSACGNLFWADDRLVWDDYLEHRQLALAGGNERILRWFVSWKELSSVAEMDPDPTTCTRLSSFAEQLLARDILIEQDSPRHRAEERLLVSWSPWGPSARAFHFSTRSHRSTPYVTADRMSATLWEKIQNGATPPSRFKSYPGVPRFPLPVRSAANWEHRDLLDVLDRRRSVREFGDDPIELSTLGALLDVVGKPITRPERAGFVVTEEMFRTSPSGGGRHPTEIYVYARNVAGLTPGLYHYSAEEHGLEQLDRSATDAELVAAAGDQEWLGKSGALLIYTSMIERSQWKYPFSRAYRVLMMDVGHLSQTVYLAATALGMSITFTAALRDEIVEDLIQCDPTSEIVVGISALGTRQT